MSEIAGNIPWEDILNSTRSPGLPGGSGGGGNYEDIPYDWSYGGGITADDEYDFEWGSGGPSGGNEYQDRNIYSNRIDPRRIPSNYNLPPAYMSGLPMGGRI